MRELKKRWKPTRKQMTEHSAFFFSKNVFSGILAMHKWQHLLCYDEESSKLHSNKKLGENYKKKQKFKAGQRLGSMDEAETPPSFGFSRGICQVSSFLLVLAGLQSNSTNVVYAAADKMAGTRNSNLYERVRGKVTGYRGWRRQILHFQQFCLLLVQNDAYLRSGGDLQFLNQI